MELLVSCVTSSLTAPSRSRLCLRSAARKQAVETLQRHHTRRCDVPSYTDLWPLYQQGSVVNRCQFGGEVRINLSTHQARPSEAKRPGAHAAPAQSCS